MEFNSISYVVFLSLAAILYWHTEGSLKLSILLGCGMLFYGMYRFDYLPLLLGTIAFDYMVGVQLGRSELGRAKRRLLLAGSIAVNLGVLSLFKYGDFTLSNINAIAGWVGHPTTFHMDIALPFGISFYIFHSLSYTIDVYRGAVRSERNFLLFANFVAFFPQLVAGPILRAREVMPQLHDKPRFFINDLAKGTERILFGLFLKCVLADNIGGWVDVAYSVDVAGMGAFDVWASAVLFGFQIYFDFSGYSHIAIGSARILGIRFPENFNFPYVAASPKEFWTRWHISLSSWVRDYLYLPLCRRTAIGESIGGLTEAVSRGAGVVPLVLTWSIMGLWHGANWTFLIWGLWHAAIILTYRVAAAAPLHIPTVAAVVLTQMGVMLAWIPFRAKDAGTALTMMFKVLDPTTYITGNPLAGGGYNGLIRALNLTLPVNIYLLAGGLTLAFYTFYFVRQPICAWAGRSCLRTFTGRVVFIASLFALDFVFLRPNQLFIYFQF